ncbi:MAG: SDR family oxidoreductase [Chloroflexaceae bacterium]|nr:SDR family oxidoreductase [Chloroflexaceae bacterium]
MKAFVTGSTGLLGSNLVRLLLQQGYAVKALARSPEKAARVFAGLDVTIVPGDMEHISGFATELAGCDVLFHTAAYFREYYQPGDHWKTLEAINIRGTIQLLAEAERHGVKKVIYTSSSGVIGMKPGSDWGDESCDPDNYVMENLYFRSKVLAEKEIVTFLTRSALPVVLILPGWMFGPGDTAPTSSGQIVLDFLNRKLPGVIEGYGSPVDARDVAQAMTNAVERGVSGERYIVGGDTIVSFAQLFKLLNQVSGVPAPSMPIPYPLALTVAFVSERISRLTGRPTLITTNGIKTLRVRRRTLSTKAVNELGATFRPFSETLRDEVAWFRANRPELMGDQTSTGSHQDATGNV